MRLVYMGTPDIARVCLQKLHEAGFEIAGVYTKPDTPKNRGMKLAQSEVKEYAVSAGLPVYQPATFKDDAAVEELRALAPDLIVVVAYGKILPQRVLDIPGYGCINMHASILPELRGAGPVQWSILNHCDETGVTAMYLTAGMDEGDIIEIRKTPIDPMETSSELMARLAGIAAELACDTVRAIEAGTATRTPQDNARATYAPMLSKEMSPIDWTGTSRAVIDHVRGLIPWPVATAELDGKKFKIFRVERTQKQTDRAPGTLLALTKQGLEIACGDGVLCITQLQAEGGKRMAAADYFRGHPIKIEV
ncbi:MAG: methionyl-tRNA formyltransferase [Oscillospiraceae bacterium]